MTIQRITGGEIMVNQEQLQTITALLGNIPTQKWGGKIEYHYQIILTDEQIILCAENGVEGFGKYIDDRGADYGYTITYIGYWSGRIGSACLLLVS